MKASSVRLPLGLAVLLLSTLTVCAVFLNPSSNRLQFLTEESVSLRCEGQQSSGGWTVRRTAAGKTQQCGEGPENFFGSFDGSSCIIYDLSSLSDSGRYWCENSDGQKSPELSITVSDVILDVPLLPVTRGSDVTLRCRTRDGNTGVAYFFMNGVSIGYGFKGEFNISKVQQSDDGLYNCATDLTGPSSQSRLTVKDLSLTTSAHHSILYSDNYLIPTPTPSFPLSFLYFFIVAALVSLIILALFLVGFLMLCMKHTGLVVQLLSGLAVSAALAVLVLSTLTVSAGVFPPPSVCVVKLLCHLVVFCPYCISTFLVISIYCRRRTGNRQPTAVEMDEHVEGEDRGTTENNF